MADLDNYGQMPIPPYFERKADETDDERYQTVFHNPTKSASVAAPTASLHFDDALLTQLRKKAFKLLLLLCMLVLVHLRQSKSTI